MVTITHVTVYREENYDRFLIDFHYTDSKNPGAIYAYRVLLPYAVMNIATPERDLILKAAEQLPLEGSVEAVKDWLVKVYTPFATGGLFVPDQAITFNANLAAPTKLPAASGSISSAVEVLPGVLEKVKHPVNGNDGRIKEIIMDLNDQHKWTREQIADWLDTLDVDLRFKAPGDKLGEKERKLTELSNKISNAQILETTFSDALKLAQKDLEEFQIEFNKLTGGNNDEN